MVQETRSVEVCFSPGLFQDVLTTGDFIVVLVDILRATTTICTAVGNGAEAIIPVADQDPKVVETVEKPAATPR